jgi:hypothetical protein
MQGDTTRALYVTLLVAGALVTIASVTPTPAAHAVPSPSSAGTAGAPSLAALGARVCRSAKFPATARRLDRAVRAALRGRKGIESVAVYARGRRLSCGVEAGRRYDSASVIKVTVLGALLRKAMEHDRRLTPRERALAHRMITRSDNDATSALWRSIGRPGLRHFLNLAKMRNTTLGKGGYWGLSQITAADQIRLLRVLTSPNRVLNDRSRRYVLSLMGRVVPGQRWGTPAGRPIGIAWHVKNGWLPRHGKYWRVHSIGSFDGRGRDYMIVVLTRDTPSMAYGVQTIERVARAVHRGLNPGRRPAPTHRVPPHVFETSDGSVPPGQ